MQMNFVTRSQVNAGSGSPIYISLVSGSILTARKYCVKVEKFARKAPLSQPVCGGMVGW